MLGGVGLNDGKARKALDSVKQHLATPNGIILQQPAYSTYHVELGEVTSYPPGYKENAGIFTHNNTWIQCAEALLGNGDQAYRVLHGDLPEQEGRADRHLSLRAVRLQPDDGRPRCPDARRGEELLPHRHGRVELRRDLASTSWASRPAPMAWWSTRASRPHWKGFKAQRKFRGKTYQIEVRNPSGKSKGVKLTVDGKPIQGNTIPLNLGGNVVNVVAEL